MLPGTGVNFKFAFSALRSSHRRGPVASYSVTSQERVLVCMYEPVEPPSIFLLNRDLWRPWPPSLAGNDKLKRYQNVSARRRLKQHLCNRPRIEPAGARRFIASAAFFVRVFAEGIAPAESTLFKPDVMMAILFDVRYRKQSRKNTDSRGERGLEGDSRQLAKMARWPKSSLICRDCYVCAALG